MHATPAAQLATCGTVAEVQALFAAAIAAHGYTVSACGAFVPTETGPEAHFFFQDWPETWIALYQRQNFIEVDFSVAEARQRVAPFTWAEMRGFRVPTRAEAALWRTANQWGWSEGLVVPIHGPGGYMGLVTMV